MKNEIKEILDFKEDADYKKLSVDEIVILENYITNLQEENKRLQDRNIELVLERDRLKQENEKQANHLISKDNLSYEDYKSRCEKANALLDEMLERAYIDGEYILYDYSTSELLEVKQALQGEDKDE